jgi:hypothetical protein
VLFKEYSFPKYLLVYNQVFDPNSESLVLAIIEDEKQYFCLKKIGQFLQEILEDKSEYNFCKDNLVEMPIACMSIQKGGKQLALGLFDGRI